MLHFEVKIKPYSEETVSIQQLLKMCGNLSSHDTRVNFDCNNGKIMTY